MSVVANGGYGVGVNASGYHFPFIREVPEAKRLFADMYLGHTIKAAVLPLRVSSITGFTQPAISSASFSDSDSPFRAEIIVVDGNDNTVFNSTNADRYRFSPWSDRLAIHEWISDSAVCRVVQHTGQNDLEDVIEYPDHQTLTGAVLDERVSEVWPSSITRIIADGNILTEDIELVGGFNFSTSLASTDVTFGSPRVNSIFLSAVAGSGLGRPPGCADANDGNSLIKTINGTGPKTIGQFTFETDGCVQFKRSGTTASAASYSGIDKEITFDTANSLKAVDMCLPCCSCDDFINTYRGLKKIYNKFLKIGDDAKKLASAEDDVITRWKSQKSLRESWPVKLLTSTYKLKDSSCIKITLGIGNHSKDCRGEFTADINFKPPPLQDGSDSCVVGFVNPDTVFIYDENGYNATKYALEGSWPDYTARWSAVNSMKHAKIKFDMTFSRPVITTWEGPVTLLTSPPKVPVPSLVNKTLTYRKLVDNVATITTTGAHGLVVGDKAVIEGLDDTFDGIYDVLSVPTSNTFTYKLMGQNVCYDEATGTASSLTLRVKNTPNSRSCTELGVLSVTTVSRVSNVVRLAYSTPGPGVVVPAIGDVINVTGVPGFNGFRTITSVGSGYFGFASIGVNFTTSLSPNGKLRKDDTLAQPAMVGRFFVTMSKVDTFDFDEYLIIGSLSWLDQTSSIEKGTRVDRLIEKSHQTKSVSSFFSGDPNTLDSWSFKVIQSPTSTSVKTNSLLVTYDRTYEWTNAAFKSVYETTDLLYSGRLYGQTVLSPISTSRINDGDYVTINITAKLNDVGILNGTMSKTVLLEVM